MAPRAPTCACNQPIAAKDWTCPHCGRILDRFLFESITPKSLSGRDQDAFDRGYQACRDQWTRTRSTEILAYRPVPNRETAYRAGWQYAALGIAAKLERRQGRRRGVTLPWTGALATAAGTVLVKLTFDHGLEYPWMILGFGLMNLAFAGVALLTGHSDE